jgi:hypothetical protein
VDAARRTAWDAAWGAVQALIAWDEARDAARRTARRTAWDAAWGAVQALIAWDEAGDILDMSVEEVQALAMVGIHAAVLLLPAAIAMNERNQHGN